MNNVPLHHNEDINGGTPDIPTSFNSHRPPNLNPTCPGHGGQDTNSCTCNDGSDGNLETHDNIPPNDTFLLLNGVNEGTDPEDGDLIHGEQGDELISDYESSDREARRVIVSYVACGCNCSCSCSGCDCHIMDSQSPPNDAWSMAPSPASSRPGSPYGYGSMVVEVGSRASSVISILRSPTPPQVADLFSFMTGGCEDGVLHVMPNGFVQMPLWLTPTLELPQLSPPQRPLLFPYGSGFNDSDFEDNTA